MIRPKYIFALVFALLIVLSLASCTDNDNVDVPDIVYHTVSFDSQLGTQLPDVKVANGKTIKQPVDPVRDGFVFDGWRINGKAWDFDTDKVTSDITLTAKWIDATQLFNYIPVEGGASITDIKREMNVIVIPSVINGLDVVAIAPHAFENPQNVDLTRIVIPESVVEIGDEAFCNCAKLSKVTLSNSLTRISSYAFARSALTEIIIPDGVTIIDEAAFLLCKELKKLVISQMKVIFIKNLIFTV